MPYALLRGCFRPQKGRFKLREYLHGQHGPLPLYIASFRAYASNALLPIHLQGSIPGPWLAATWVGFPPTRLRGLAKLQLMGNPHFLLAKPIMTLQRLVG